MIRAARADVLPFAAGAQFRADALRKRGYLATGVAVAAVALPFGVMEFETRLSLPNALTGGIALAAFGLTVAAVPLLQGRASTWGLLDIPGGRKQHLQAVPRVGGLAIVLAAGAVLGVSALFAPWTAGARWGWLAGCLLVALVSGVLDDRRALRWRAKGMMQVTVASVLVLAGGFRVSSLGLLLGSPPLQLGVLSAPFSILVLLGFINSLNLVDGIDGLAGGFSAVALTYLAIAAWRGGRSHAVLVTTAFSGAALGFCLYNMRSAWRDRASVFLGNCGSDILALVIGAAALRLGASAPLRSSYPPISVAWILALPIMDTVVVILGRLGEGNSPFAGDRMHLHYLLVDLGFSQTGVSACLVMLASVYGAVGVLGSRFLAERDLFLIWLGVFAAHSILVRQLRVRGTRQRALHAGDEAAM
jgi:UDP-GlcNAc:undecaprenyl-phosphate GlcNAc-1-phosphate transferase